MSKKILIIDDELDILEILSFTLIKEGYKVYTASSGESGIKKALKQIPDAIILDVMMPDMDGIETCQQIKAEKKLKDCFVLFLTARSEEYSQMAGYNAGADDYITKPIKPKIIAKKIEAILKRSKIDDSNELKKASSERKVKVYDLVLDREKFYVKKNNEKIYLPKKEFDLLFLLTSEVGRVFTREEILKNVWEKMTIVNGRTIDVHLSKLREKIGEKYFKTVKGVGYKFQIDGDDNDDNEEDLDKKTD